MSYTGTLQPGAELGDGPNGKKPFDSPYSSFAISIDTRNIESSHALPADRSARKPKSALKHSLRARSASDEFQPTTFSTYGLSGKKLNGLLPSRDDEKHNVRFGAMPGLKHHRRSSTAAFLEYINRHLPENSRHQPPMLTLKRAFLMFCIVFSATYLAMSLLPGSAVWRRDARQPEAYMVKRGAGYYGNSNIFQSGEVIAEQSDEHSLYLVQLRQPAKNGKTDKMPSTSSLKVIPGEIEPVATQDLRGDTATGPKVVAEDKSTAATKIIADHSKPDHREPPSRLKAIAEEDMFGDKEPLYQAKFEGKDLFEVDEDAELEKKIAELKHRRASRRGSQKKGPARHAGHEAVVAPLEKEDAGKIPLEPKLVAHPPKVGKDALRKVAAMRRKDSAYDTPLLVQ